jgi:hypothetical protein
MLAPMHNKMPWRQEPSKEHGHGSTITNTYDIMGRVLTTTVGGTSLTYVYDVRKRGRGKGDGHATALKST